MKKEEALKIIETRICDLDMLIDICARNPKQKEELEMLQRSKNELVLVRDAIAIAPECEV